MMEERYLIEQRLSEKDRKAKADRLMMRLFIGASSILFFTLIIIWALQRLPQITVPEVYHMATWMIVLSSFCIGMSQLAIAKDELEKSYRFTGAGLVLGIVFSILQLMGWKELLVSNESFRNILFPFSLVHFVHVLIGIILLITIFRGLRKYKVHSRATHYASNVFLFWHFLGGVWLVFVWIS